ncbi:hypothetical protein JHK82_012081 [Glycine max]|nr:hypothetical protein JHK85_012406 [Glycine max]KAG5057081.1 hypothetical protein JHK86_012077 [Glycine max]KAG5154112.1 hypothetical protein JHK82_012081 [Glycine max]
MAESNRKEDIVVDGSTFGSWRKRKGKLKARKHKSKKGSKRTMNNDPKSNVHSIYRRNGLFAPPEVDFVSLYFHGDHILRYIVFNSLSQMRCFQLLNPKILLQLTAATIRIFQVLPRNRALAIRLPEKH